MAIIGTDMNLYFAHDANAMQDAKLMRLRREHGYEGIGIYWALIELLRQSYEYEYEFDPDLIADVLRIPDKAGIVGDIIANEKFDLFTVGTDPNTANYFTSPDLNANMDFMESKRQTQSDAAHMTNLKRYGTIPKDWTPEKLSKQWQTLNTDEQQAILGKMSEQERVLIQKALIG